MREVWGAALILVSFALLGFELSVHRSFVNPYSKICDMVEQRIYLSVDETRDWIKTCRSRAAKVGPFTKTSVIVRDARTLLEQLQVSHLEIYHPQEVSRLWSGWNRETGLESEFVEGQLVVFHVHEGSPADKAGIKPGDLVLEIQGTTPAPVVVKTLGGRMKFRRLQNIFEIEIEPKQFKIDERPSFRRLDDQTITLKVPSFRADFFDKELWPEFVAKVPSAPRMIVDLRGNPGGNFVSGLRFLAPFMCGEQDIGYLIKPRLPMRSEARLPNDLRDEVQLDHLENHELIHLRTPISRRCFTSRVTVLVDSYTASTAEMVAQALRDYVDARVLGSTSAGQLLVGVWHHFPELGSGWRFSIPEAVYQSRRGKRLEGGGVSVDRVLYYELNEMMAGQDSWLSRALTDFRREPANSKVRASVSK